MSEENKNDEVTESALESLKSRADLMGITYHPSIGEEKLQEKIDAVLAEKAEEAAAIDAAMSGPAESVSAPEAASPFENAADMNSAAAQGPAPEVEVPAEETAVQAATRVKRECNRLVRVRVTNMNPMKKDYEGEIFTTGNAVTGTIKKYVPFNVEWHVPRMILEMIQERQYQGFVTVTEGKRKRRVGRLIKEFGVEILPDLTETELKELAQRQAMAAGTAEAS